MDRDSWLERLRQGLVRLELLLVAASLLLLLGLSLAQIGARNFFDTGLPNADALIRHLVLYVAFFGAALAVEANQHIRIDVVTAWLPERAKQRLFRPLAALACVVSLIFLYAAARFWWDEWNYAADHDRWLALLKQIIPLGFGLLSLHFLLAVLLGPNPRPPRPPQP